MKDKPLKTYSLDEVTDKFIGKLGTPKREAFEHELTSDSHDVALCNSAAV